MTTNSPDRLKDGPVLIAASAIKIQSVTWLWDGWLAASKFHILGGAPGDGKTTLALKVAATISSGGKWPDGTRAKQGTVVIWSGEDGIEDTLAPRLKAAEADLSRVLFVEGMQSNGFNRAFDPANDLKQLIEKLQPILDLKLLIIDPVVSTITGDSNKNAEVRRELQPLVDLANATKCAVIGITHFSKNTSGKNPIERITGSLAFGALARVVWATAKSGSAHDGSRIFCRAKSNIGPDSGGFTYSISNNSCTEGPTIDTSRVIWGSAVSGSARDLLAATETPSEDNGALAGARKFLLTILANGPVRTKDLESESEAAGLSWATVRRASSALFVEKVKQGMDGPWVWQLPRSKSVSSEDAHTF